MVHDSVDRLDSRESEKNKSTCKSCDIQWHKMLHGNLVAVRTGHIESNVFFLGSNRAMFPLNIFILAISPGIGNSAIYNICSHQFPKPSHWNIEISIDFPFPGLLPKRPKEQSRTNNWSHRHQWDSRSILLAAPGARYVWGCLPYKSFADSLATAKIPRSFHKTCMIHHDTQRLPNNSNGNFFLDCALHMDLRRHGNLVRWFLLLCWLVKIGGSTWPLQQDPRHNGFTLPYCKLILCAILAQKTRIKNFRCMLIQIKWLKNYCWICDMRVFFTF